MLDLQGARLAASRKAGSEKELDLKPFIDKYRQRRSSSIGQSKVLDLEPDESIFLPTVDAATTDVTGALESSAHSIANFIGDKLDMTKTSGYIKDLYSEYKSKSEQGKRGEATQVALELVRELGKPGMIGEELDLAGMFKTLDPAMANYLEENIMALNDLEGFYTGKLFSAGINPISDPLLQYEGIDEGTTLIEEEGKGTSLGDVIKSFIPTKENPQRGFFNSIFGE